MVNADDVQLELGHLISELEAIQLDACRTKTQAYTTGVITGLEIAIGKIEHYAIGKS